MDLFYYIHPDIDKRQIDADFYEYFTSWTTNHLVALKFIEEFSTIGMRHKIEIIRAKDFSEFTDIIKTEWFDTVTEFNELHINFSEIRPEIYHCTTPDIEEQYVSNGLADSQYQFILQAICRSSLNIFKISKYMKNSSIKKNVERLMGTYLQTLILLDNTDMALDPTSDEMKMMVDKGYKPDDVRDGTMAVLDLATLERLCAGIAI